MSDRALRSHCCASFAPAFGDPRGSQLRSKPRFNFQTAEIVLSRHCEPTGRREAPPDDRLREAIHGAAKLDCFVAEFIIGPDEGGTRWLLANDGVPPRSRGRICPSFYKNRSPRKMRAWGMPGAQCSVVTTGPPEHPAFPHAMVLRLTSRSPRRPGFIVTVVSRIMALSKARLGGLTSAKLDASLGASEPHDFAVRFNAVRLRAGDRSRIDKPALRHFVRAGTAASTASRPASVTIAIRPSSGTRRRESWS